MRLFAALACLASLAACETSSPPTRTETTGDPEIHGWPRDHCGEPYPPGGVPATSNAEACP